MKYRIILLVIILIISILSASKIVQYRTTSTVYQDSTQLYKTKYYRIVNSYKEHMKKCAFISKDQIQRINGRHILLYSNSNVNRKLNKYN